MKKCLIVQNGFHSIPSSENRYLRLKEELEKRGVATETVTTDKVVAYLTGKGDIALTCFSMPDFVLFLDKDNYVAQMLEGLGLRLFNSAERVAEILGLDYCACDLLIGSDGEPILTEVNSNAFFAEGERVTGVDVAGAYAEYIVRNID